MRTILLLLAVWHGANGILMLTAPDAWYGLVPGVTETGPANIHFIRDIGLGFLAASVAVALASRSGTTLVIVPALAFLGGHALLHLAEMATHGGNATDTLRDVLLIVVPGLLPAIALLPSTHVQRRAA